jgi:hypothetical protein
MYVRRRARSRSPAKWAVGNFVTLSLLGVRIKSAFIRTDKTRVKYLHARSRADVRFLLGCCLLAKCSQWSQEAQLSIQKLQQQRHPPEKKAEEQEVLIFPPLPPHTPPPDPFIYSHAAPPASPRLTMRLFAHFHAAFMNSPPPPRTL